MQLAIHRDNESIGNNKALPGCSSGCLVVRFGGDINWLCCPVGGINPNRTGNSPVLRMGARNFRRTKPLELGLEQRAW